MPYPEQESTAQRHAITLGWVCLVSGMFVMFASLWLFFLYGPLYVTALGFAIVAMAQKRVFSGVALLVVLLVVPTACWALLAIYRGVDAADRGVTKVQKHVERVIEEGREKQRQPFEEQVKSGVLPPRINPALGPWYVTLWKGSDGAAEFTRASGGFERCDGQAFIFWMRLNDSEGSRRVFEIDGGGNRGAWHGDPVGASGWFELASRPDLETAREIPFHWNENRQESAPKQGVFTRR